jgi:hypothetical protein
MHITFFLAIIYNNTSSTGLSVIKETYLAYVMIITSKIGKIAYFFAIYNDLQRVQIPCPIEDVF